MTDKYIVVKVRDADARLTPGSANTNLGSIRKAIHERAEARGNSIADMVTHTGFMTEEESADIARIFEGAMNRAKHNHKKKIQAEWIAYYENR